MSLKSYGFFQSRHIIMKKGNLNINIVFTKRN